MNPNEYNAIVIQINMTDLISGLSNQVFGPQNRYNEGRIASQAGGIVESLIVYTMPPGLDPDTRLSVLSFMTGYGRSEDDIPSKWASWTLTYLCCCFPEFKDQIIRQNAREYKFEMLPKTYINAVKEAIMTAQEIEGSATADEKYSKAVARIVKPSRFPDIDHNDLNFPPVLAAAAIVEPIYGYASLLLFLCGKKITDKNMVTITERRPQNLIDTYSIDEDAAYPLIGEGKMESTAHQMVHQAWITYAAARIAIMTEIAAFGAGQTLPQRVVHTVTKLLEYSGMQPAFFIHRFLQAFPEAATYSCIRPSLNAYASSIREVASAAAHLQPYYKLIHGDGTRAFHRNSIMALSACAIAYEKYTSPSMRNFVLGEGANAALAMFDGEAISRGHQTLQSLTFVSETHQSAE